MDPKKLSVSEIEVKLIELNKSLKKITVFGSLFLLVGFPFVILPLFEFSGWFGLVGVILLVVAAILLLFMVDPIELEIDHLKLDLRTKQGRINYNVHRGLAAPPG